ncbi:hypothetical protein OIU84_008846 [Salix udensis]|uniref:Arabinogalactan peptide 23-like n=1 Tax=Salix udensis TaxID=889485 RepID=A0AAD6NY48_9ROSI|nr:hypothetical protein OIU84_008846 [Salix udensis]
MSPRGINDTNTSRPLSDGRQVCVSEAPPLLLLECKRPRKNKMLTTMEMKRIACVILFAAASVSAVMADEAAAPAPSPASGASASLPIVGSLVGASLASFIALYLQ